MNVMKQPGVRRVICPSCRLQFEPLGRSGRCPVCGTRVTSSAVTNEPLPPLPSSLRVRLATEAPIIYGRETRWGLLGICAVYGLAGVMLVANGVRTGSFILVGAGVLLLLLVTASAIGSNGFQETSVPGPLRHAADAPVYVVALLAVGVTLGSLGVVVYIVSLLHPFAGVMLFGVIVFVAVAAWTHFGEEMSTSQQAQASRGLSEVGSSGGEGIGGHGGGGGSADG